MSRKPKDAPSLFGGEHMAPVARPAVELPVVRTVPRQVPPSLDPVANDDEAPAPRDAMPSTQVPDDVIVEALPDGRFLVSRLRENGTTVAAIYWTRIELEKLHSRVTAALEVA